MQNGKLRGKLELSYLEELTWRAAESVGRKRTRQKRQFWNSHSIMLRLAFSASTSSVIMGQSWPQKKE